jgi:hypothetical protein
VKHSINSFEYFFALKRLFYISYLNHVAMLLKEKKNNKNIAKVFHSFD